MVNESNNAVATIEAREKELIEQMDRIQRELEELATAKRVWQRLGGQPIAARPPPPEKPSPRPSGTPTNVEMAEFVIASAEKEGKDGLTAQELVQAIGARYWPGLVSDQIMPSLYMAAKDGRLRKTKDGKFKRAKKAGESE